MKRRNYFAAVLIAISSFAAGCTTVTYSQTGPTIASVWPARKRAPCLDNRNYADCDRDYLEIVRKTIDVARPMYPEVFSELDGWINEHNELEQKENSLSIREGHPESQSHYKYGIGDYYVRVGMPKEILRIFYCEPNRIRLKPRESDARERNADEVWEYDYTSDRVLYFIKDGKIMSIKYLVGECL